MGEHFISNRCKKAARIYFTVMPENEKMFRPSVIDKAEREAMSLFDDQRFHQELVNSGLFKKENDTLIITELGIKVAKEEVDSSRKYIQSLRKNNILNQPDEQDDHRQQPINFLKLVMSLDPGKLMSLSIYCLQALHSRDEHDRLSKNPSDDTRLRRVLESAMNGGTETVIPRAKDKNGKSLTERTGLLFGQEYDQDTFGVILYNLLKDGGMISDCCEYTPLPKD
jgi:hypothetical protein